MRDNEHYRRKEDEGARLLILLTERMTVIQETLKDLTGARVKYLEKIVWAAVLAIFLLTMEVVFRHLPI